MIYKKLLENSNVLIQADAGSNIGVGHIMRMIALGQLISKMGFSIHFVSFIEEKQIIRMIKKEGFNLYNLKLQEGNLSQKDFVSLCKNLNPKTVIMDGKFIGINTEKVLRKLNYKLIRVVDIPQNHLSVDLVINPNLGAEKFKYSLEPYTKTALGLEYVALRSEFLNPSRMKSNTKKFKKRILVSLGGSQLNTRRIYDEFDLIANLLSDKFELEIIDGIKNFNMALKMSNSDFAFVSGGSTMWEALRLKLPFHVITLNDLQKTYISSVEGDKYWFGATHYDSVSIRSINKVIKDFFDDPDIEYDLRKKFDTLKVGDSIEELIYQFLMSEPPIYV